MSTFPLRVGTPDGLLYEGDVARVVCRTISGDLAILPGHCNYCTALGMGEAHIVLEDGTRRNAACIGGMLSMMNGVCRVLATTCIPLSVATTIAYSELYGKDYVFKKAKNEYRLGAGLARGA